MCQIAYEGAIGVEGSGRRPALARQTKGTGRALDVFLSITVAISTRLNFGFTFLLDEHDQPNAGRERGNNSQASGVRHNTVHSNGPNNKQTQIHTKCVMSHIPPNIFKRDSRIRRFLTKLAAFLRGRPISRRTSSDESFNGTDITDIEYPRE